MHWTARRLLTALPDGTLEPAREAKVLEHLDGCRRCQRRHAQIEMAEDLLRRMPASLVPLDPHPSTHARLSRLARWSEEPDLPPRLAEARSGLIDGQVHRRYCLLLSIFCQKGDLPCRCPTRMSSK